MRISKRLVLLSGVVSLAASTGHSTMRVVQKEISISHVLAGHVLVQGTDEPAGGAYGNFGAWKFWHLRATLIGMNNREAVDARRQYVLAIRQQLNDLEKSIRETGCSPGNTQELDHLRRVHGETKRLLVVAEAELEEAMHKIEPKP